MMKPLPIVSNVYSMIIQEERQRDINIPHSISLDVITMQVSTNQTLASPMKTLVCIVTSNFRKLPIRGFMDSNGSS